ncbi:MAG: preprotein translocase subunit SecA [Cytophagales bacterium]
MIDIISKGLAKIFGTKSERDIKEVSPYVAKINQIYSSLAQISDDDLRGKSAELKLAIQEHLKSINLEIEELRSQALESGVSVAKKENLFKQIDEKIKSRDQQLEKVLLDILPDAFAIVKETARRFRDNGKLEVTANEFDKLLAVKKDNVVINGEKAVWANTWKVMGNDITWNMVHYDVQLIGGIVLHQGKISEMATGEGKTLVSTLPSFLNALAGYGVHLVTVNDYLAKRDSEWNAPLFEFHGLSVDCIDKHEPNSDARRNAYLADITYGTNNEFGFDYLRDNMGRTVDELVQRKLHYAIVDEVDSVLIDDARTPLIISGPVPKGDQHMFQELKPFVVQLFEEQKKLVNTLFIEAKKGIEQNAKNEEAALSLFRVYRGLPKSKPLIKFLSEPGMKAILQKTQNFYLQDNKRDMPKADAPLLFTIEEKHNSIDITTKGFEFLTKYTNDDKFFVLPDVATEKTKIDKDTTLTEEQKVEKTERLINDYSVKSERIHTISQLLKAYTMFEKEVDYIIVENKVKIVDEQTGRVLEGRRYSDGLHQALEAKENVKIEDGTQTYATITLQNYFRMYHKLSGMTGTAETEAGEFYEIYKLDVVVIPTNLPTSRVDHQDKVFLTIKEKFNAVADEIVALTEQNRPVLVGTTSVEISEVLSRMLKMRNIKHQVLNAKYHQKEAEIVAEAGKPKAVTIATNMAGRGTDIKLSAEAKASGGLAIIGTERHESRRVDRQLRGRAGRQGDPGSSQFFVSMQDELMRINGSDKVISLLDRLGMNQEDGEAIQSPMITKQIENAQKRVESNNFGYRKHLLEYDDVMNSQREVVYKRRKNALFGERLSIDIINMLFEVCDMVSENAKLRNSYETFTLEVIGNLGYSTQISQSEFEVKTQNEVSNLLYQEAVEKYATKKKSLAEFLASEFHKIDVQTGGRVENIHVGLTDGVRQLGLYTSLKKTVETNGDEFIKDMEKSITLGIIDDIWKDHLREMDDLKQSVRNAVYEQKDPLVIYKIEAYNIFKTSIDKINSGVISFLMKAELPREEAPLPVSPAQMKLQKQEYVEHKDDFFENHEEEFVNDEVKQAPIVSQKIAGRNDRVTVQYMDGTIKKDVKFKTVEEDLKASRCVILEVHST